MTNEEKAEEHTIRIFTSAYNIGEFSVTDKYLPTYTSVDIKVTDEQWHLLKGSGEYLVTVLGVELLENK